MAMSGPEALRPASAARHDVETLWDVRIAVRDGVELSANIWRPASAGSGGRPERVPAILEVIPYGKDSWRRNADVGRGEYFAARGYALCRVDVRGTGSSGGVALDEYTEDETRDGAEVVAWLAAQPWCDGNVGMWGISYGGFTAIQVAKLRPPALRAIVPVQATDDRYLTDVHYIGGCVTASELSQYAVSQVAMNAMPPDRTYRGDAWLEEWRARLGSTPPWLIGWLRQQHDGRYWRSGSLAPEYDAIEAAILNIGGWMDAYVDAAFRMQEHCSAPSRTLVGNWVHGLPASATPGPNLDELHEMIRFFDHHLRGIDNGMADEPAVVWFERD
ncbi:MAG TPA: CocE/NonD family hydrolase, partial [Vitreimonas sp.]|nr:CocE/NonD family hydrolase [Vitreimonas sp.]